MDLSPVSRTAILTLICRAVASAARPQEYPDPMAQVCLDRLIAAASGEDLRWLLREQRVYSGMQRHHAFQGVRRSLAFDHIASRFISEHPGCSVVNLACGFDTRYWRIDRSKCTFIDMDLPEVIRLKNKILAGELTYEAIGSSVLDTAWMEHVTRRGNASFLLLAEGLFAWLDEAQATGLISEISRRFQRSLFVFDLLPVAYTKGIWKFFQRLDARISWGLTGVDWAVGIRDPGDIEKIASGLKIIASGKGAAGPILSVAVNAGPV